MILEVLWYAETTKGGKLVKMPRGMRLGLLVIINECYTELNCCGPTKLQQNSVRDSKLGLVMKKDYDRGMRKRQQGA